MDQYFNLLLIQLQNAHKRLLRNLHVADLAHALLAFLLLLQQLALTGNVAAVALGEHVLAHGLMALTVSRAMIFPPTAAWIGISNKCFGISSFNFSHIFLPRS